VRLAAVQNPVNFHSVSQPGSLGAKQA